MIIQYYCYHQGSYFFSGITYGMMLDIGFACNECEWIVPGTMQED